MLRKFLYTVLISIPLSLVGQDTAIQCVLDDYSIDSSFYDIAKINENEFWLGGESGVLYRTDTLGNIHLILAEKLNETILKIVRHDRFVYLALGKNKIMRYDLHTEDFFVKEFPYLENKCIYDLIVLDDGNVMICGGDTEIAEAKVAIPRGYIATLDPDLTNLTFSWKSYNHFVWALLQMDDGEIYASTFDGISTRILRRTYERSWKKQKRIIGLVHNLHQVDGDLWYTGTLGLNLTKNGIYGKVFERHSPVRKFKQGAIWTFTQLNNTMVAFAEGGSIIEVGHGEAKLSPFASAFTIYDVEEMGQDKLLVVGRGKSACIVSKAHFFDE